MPFLRDVDHRPPILCLDRVIACDAESATCAFDVVVGPHVSNGQMWEPGLIEGMAQTTALIKGRAAREAGAAVQPGMLVGLKNLTITRCPSVGETVHFTARIVRSIGPMTLVECATLVGDETVASGEMKFYLGTDDDEVAT